MPVVVPRAWPVPFLALPANATLHPQTRTEKKRKKKRNIYNSPKASYIHSRPNLLSSARMLMLPSLPVVSDLLGLEDSNGATEIIAVVGLRYRFVSIDRNHAGARFGTQCIDEYLAAPVHADHVLLTALCVQTSLVVIVKEAVQPSTVDEDVRGSDDAETPCLPACVGGAGAEVRVVKVTVGGKGLQSIRIRLEIWSLGLNSPHVDIVCIGDLIVVQLAVLGAGTVQPDRTLLGLDQDTATVEDVELVVVATVELVIGNPEPVVLQIDGCRLCDM